MKNLSHSITSAYWLYAVRAMAMSVVLTLSIAIHSSAVLADGLSTDDARHLLMRTGFGARAGDVVRLQGLSREQAVDIIVSGMSDQPAVPMPDWVNQPVPAYHARADMIDETRALFNAAREAEIAQLRQWWIVNMLQSDSPQSDRLVLFWHDLFATSYRDLNRHSLAMARQHQLFRSHGFGSWKLLLRAMIRDAALLKYLDSDSNHKASPNENLARELMELFVLGEGNYEETAVREAARALTGHDTTQFHDLQFRLKTWAQDRGEKRLFGQTGPFDGDDLVDILLLQEAAPRFLATRFWHAFVSDTTPASSWVAEQAQLFRQSDLDISTLYENVLLSDAFWDTSNRGAIVKSPVDIIIGTAVTLDYPLAHWQKMPQWQKLIGMDLFAPPNVSGWTEGAAFITPGRLLNRYRVIKQLIRAPTKTDASAESGMQEQAMQSQSMQDQEMHSEFESAALALKASKSEAPDDRLQASSVHFLRVNANEKNGNRVMEIVLNDVQMPEKQFQHVRFRVEKKQQEPLMLQLDSFSCWPDCVERWPECAWTDKHFKDTRSIALPWVAKSDDYWSDAHDHQCQFSELSSAEKQLLSTLWAELPDLLARLKMTKRFQNNQQRWQSIIDAVQDDYESSSVSLSQTAYADFAQGLLMSEEFTRPEHVRQPLKAPESRVANVRQLVSALAERNLEVHDLLLPALSGEHVPAAPSSEGLSPAAYVRAVIEHPLFQLK